MGHQQQQQQQQQQPAGGKAGQEKPAKQASAVPQPEGPLAARAPSGSLGEPGRSKSGEASGLPRDAGFYSPASSMAGSPHAAGRRPRRIHRRGCSRAVVPWGCCAGQEDSWACCCDMAVSLQQLVMEPPGQAGSAWS